MWSAQHRIHLLDIVSQSQIQSSVHTTSLNEVIVELVKNALDANARSIQISLNYSNGFCSVEDDGDGIAVEDFAPDGRLAEIYCTSKSDELSNRYGRSGRCLAAISGAALLSISSRRRSGNVQTLWINESGRLNHYVEDEQDVQDLHGTTVRVYNLFAKFPVRRTYAASRFTSRSEVAKELERLKHQITALLLACSHDFNLDVGHTDSNFRFGHRRNSLKISSREDLWSHRRIEFVSSVLRQLDYIDKSRTVDWQEASVSSQDFNIYAVISSVPSPHKLVQFISLDQHPLNSHTQPESFAVVNSIFDRSTFGSIEQEGSGGDDVLINHDSQQPRVERPTHHGKSIDRWPTFVIWINIARGNIKTSHDVPSDNMAAVMSRCSVLLGALVSEYLISRGFPMSSKIKPTVQDISAPSIPTLSTPIVDDPHLLPGLMDLPGVQSGSASTIGNILLGLPFHSRGYPDELEACEASVLQQANTLIGPECFGKCRSQSPPSTDKTLEWTDPQTGNVVHLDARTGIALPKFEPSPPYDQSTGRFQKTAKVLSSSQAAQNARKYLPSLSSDKERPIYSIGYFRSGCSSVSNVNDKFTQRFGKPFQAHSFQDDVVHGPRLSRADLVNLTILGQVDRKFILGVALDSAEGSTQASCSRKQLILIDQHAADERAKVEELLRSFFDQTVILDNPIIWETSAREADLLEQHKYYFERLHISYEVSKVQEEPCNAVSVVDPTFRISITALPEVIVERCRLQPKIIIDLLRGHIWSSQEFSAASHFPGRMAEEHHCGCDVEIASLLPTRLLNILNSRACRSATMFNDELTYDQCMSLVSSLAKCALPFQCAHGRPSVVTLIDMTPLPIHDSLVSKATTLQSLGVASHARQDGECRHGYLNTINDDTSFGSAYMNWIEQGDLA